MKFLEYCYGYINLTMNPFFEIVIKRDSKDILSCWLESSGRDLFIFSFEEEKDAKIFRNIFWSKLKKFVDEDNEKILNLNHTIHETIERFMKENI